MMAAVVLAPMAGAVTVAVFVAFCVAIRRTVIELWTMTVTGSGHIYRSITPTRRVSD